MKPHFWRDSGSWLVRAPSRSGLNYFGRGETPAAAWNALWHNWIWRKPQ